MVWLTVMEKSNPIDATAYPSKPHRKIRQWLSSVIYFDVFDIYLRNDSLMADLC